METATTTKFICSCWMNWLFRWLSLYKQSHRQQVIHTIVDQAGFFYFFLFHTFYEPSESRQPRCSVVLSCYAPNMCLQWCVCRGMNWDSETLDRLEVWPTGTEKFSSGPRLTSGFWPLWSKFDTHMNSWISWISGWLVAALCWKHKPVFIYIMGSAFCCRPHVTKWWKYN